MSLKTTRRPPGAAPSRGRQWADLHRCLTDIGVGSFGLRAYKGSVFRINWRASLWHDGPETLELALEVGVTDAYGGLQWFSFDHATPAYLAAEAC